MATPAEDPAAYENYYYGLRGTPTLLARSNKSPWVRPEELLDDGYHSGLDWVRKEAYVITRHPIRQKLDSGLRDNIRRVLATMSPCKWISVDYLRIGYDKVEQNNPVVILVTVEEHQVPRAEAQRIVDCLADECRKVELDDVEVEIMEGQRAEHAEDKCFGEQNPLTPQQYPHVGASIGISHWCGTLGGYILVDGKAMVLTNHHVAFGHERLEGFPTAEEAKTGMSYACLQPAAIDLEERVKDLELARDGLIKTRDKKPLTNLEAVNLESITEELEKLKCWWTPERSVIGKVFKSSGIRARHGPKYRRFRLDWALIELENPARFTEQGKFVNELLPALTHNRSSNMSYFRQATRASGTSQSQLDMPEYLKRGLTFQEVLNKKAAAEEDDNKYVVWKFGRTSHYTFGIVSEILSDYRAANGVISDELMVKDPEQILAFTKDGDSGSLVWDADGYVSALAWGGKVGSFVTYVTPIEYVLEDIQRACNAKDVRLVVRKEDETDVIFGPPAQAGADVSLESTSATGPSLFDDDIVAEAFGAEADDET